MSNSRIVRLGLWAFGVVFAVAAYCQTPPPLIQVVRTTVKPERIAEYREVTKRFSEAHEKAGAEFLYVWRSMNNPYEYLTVSPRENYASFDEPSPSARGMSEAERAGLVARRRQCTDSVEITIRQPLSDLSIPWPGSEPPKRISTVTHRVRPGKVDQYLELQKQLAEGLKQNGFEGYGGHRMMWGGKGTTLVTWAALEKMADLDGDGLVARGIDEENRGAWFEQAQSLLETAVEWGLWVYEPELSFRRAEE